MSTANLPLLTQISLGICSADDRHSPEKLEHKCAENAQPMLEKYRPQLCQGWQNQQQQLQPLWCQTYCTQHPFVQYFQTSPAWLARPPQRQQLFARSGRAVDYLSNWFFEPQRHSLLLVPVELAGLSAARVSALQQSFYRQLFRERLC